MAHIPHHYAAAAGSFPPHKRICCGISQLRDRWIAVSALALFRYALMDALPRSMAQSQAAHPLCVRTTLFAKWLEASLTLHFVPIPPWVEDSSADRDNVQMMHARYCFCTITCSLVSQDALLSLDNAKYRPGSSLGKRNVISVDSCTDAGIHSGTDAHDQFRLGTKCFKTHSRGQF